MTAIEAGASYILDLAYSNSYCKTTCQKYFARRHQRSQVRVKPCSCLLRDVRRQWYDTFSELHYLGDRMQAWLYRYC